MEIRFRQGMKRAEHEQRQIKNEKKSFMFNRITVSFSFHFDEQRKLVYSVETLLSVAFTFIERSKVPSMETFTPPHKQESEGKKM